MTNEINRLIPDNYVGKPTNLSSSLILQSREESLLCYQRASKRLLNPPIWHKLSGWASASFELTGSDAERKERLAEEGDHFKINIPGPGPSAGEGYDWVIVEKIKE